MYKKIIKYSACVISVLVLILFINHSCQTSEKLSRLKGQYKASSKIAKADQEISEKIIKEQYKLISSYDKEVKTLETKISGKNLTIAKLGTGIYKLEGELKNIDPEDKDAIIVNLTQQVQEWRERFTLAQGVIKDQEDVIFTLKKEITSYKSIICELNMQLDREQRLHDLAKDMLKHYEKKTIRLKFGSSIKSALLALAAGYVVYGLIKE